MKTKHFFYALLCAATVIAACNKNEDEPDTRREGYFTVKMKPEKSSDGYVVTFYVKPNDYNYDGRSIEATVDWGDGQTDSYVSIDYDPSTGMQRFHRIGMTHSYSDSVEYLVKVSVKAEQLDIQFSSSESYALEGIGSCSAIEVIHLPMLRGLHCANSTLARLDVTKNSELKHLDCRNTGLTSIDVSHNAELEYLDCNENLLSKLDVSHNIKLEELYCSKNLLSDIDVSRNTQLSFFGCESNSLSALDVSHNAELRSLFCGNNKLENLDLSACTKLAEVSFRYNHLLSLSIGSSEYLEYVDCVRNWLGDIMLNKLFEDITTRIGKKAEYYAPPPPIYIWGNPGTAYCKTNIATAKGWTVLTTE